MNKRVVKIGNVAIGGNNKVAIQSMTNTDTRDAISSIEQIKALVTAGCDIVRVSVFDRQCIEPLKKIVENSPCPIVADIHFDYRLAIASIESGVAKLRLNPGNIGDESRIKMAVDCAKMHKVPIRIGVNSGSLEKDLLDMYEGPCAKALFESALRHVRILEKNHFEDIVISMKASNVRTCVEAYRLADKVCDYPLHIGVTEAGLKEEGSIKSAIGLGSLLLDGIGDTMRVSLSANPVEEIYAAKNILKAIGLLEEGIDIISCPTCGRTRIELENIANRVKKELSHIKKPIKVAVMGCIVNGPGEAKEADIGIAGGTKDVALLFKKGQKPYKICGDIAGILIEEVKKLADDESTLID